MNKIFAQNQKIYLAMEYMSADLGKIIQGVEFKINEEDIKYLFKSIVKGIHFLHQSWILHRVGFLSPMLGSKAC